MPNHPPNNLKYFQNRVEKSRENFLEALKPVPPAWYGIIFRAALEHLEAVRELAAREERQARADNLPN